MILHKPGHTRNLLPAKIHGTEMPGELNWAIWSSQRTDRRYAQSPPRCPLVCIGRAKEGRPKEGNRESGADRRAVVEHRDPGAQMLHRRNVDVYPIGASAGVETGNIHECAALNPQEG